MSEADSERKSVGNDSPNLSESKLKELCLDLAKADDELKVKQILEQLDIWADERYWRDYGDDDTNFSEIGNQQSKPIDAKVEKLTNAIDAMLLREAKSRGIDVEDRNDAPIGMDMAAEKFFDVEDGDLRNLSKSERTELAKEIALVASGEKGRGADPTYTIIDRGEGQHPHNFPTTFLSLAESNKLRIPFVTGKFNMGGTGVLPFCGDKNIQLIISRRAPELVDEDEPRLWGFTIVRRFDPSEIGDDNVRARNPVYRYLTINGEVPSFHADELPLRPSDEPHPDQCSNRMDHGTFVKLYNYQTPTATNIVLDPNYRLSSRLPNPALPIRLYETREGFSGHSLQATLSGLNLRLHDDRNKNIESGFPASSTVTVGKSRFNVRIFAITPQSQDRNVKRYRKASDGIIFTLNGQAHGSFHERFFSRKNVGMGYLKDSLIVLIEADDMAQDDRSKLFMNSRDRFRDTDFRDKLENKLEKVFSNHQGLRELRDQRQREDIEKSIEEDSPLTDALDDIVQDSPSLTSLFTGGSSLEDPMEGDEDPDGEQNITETGSKNGEDSFDGETFPTYFNIIDDHQKRTVAKNSDAAIIHFETDAANDYFDRDSKPGSFVLSAEGERVSNYSISLWNGTGQLRIDWADNPRISETDIGETLSYHAAVSDPTRREDPFINKFSIEVGPESKSSQSGDSTNDQGDNNEEKPLQPTELDIPEPVFVEKEEWDDFPFDFDENEAMFVSYLGEETGYRFYVNEDNRFLNSYLENEAKAGQTEVIKAKFKYSIMLIGLSMLSDLAEEQGVEGGIAEAVQTPDEEPDIEEKINRVARAAARVIIPTVERMDELEEM
jgi:hypothetical protein